jgi:hypothetical protein
LREYLEDQKRLSDFGQILKRNLQLDQNWILAASCLAAQGIVVKLKTRELGISDKFRDETTGYERWKNTRELLEEIEGKLKSQGVVPTKFKIFQAYNEEYRNNVIHGYIQIDRRTANQILEATKDLFTELGLAKKTESSSQNQ